MDNYKSGDVLKYPHPVLKSSLLKKKEVKRFTILGDDYVLFRNKNGKPVAMPDSCPHRGALLSKGKVNAEGELECPYHAWKMTSSGTAVSPSVPKKVCSIHLLKTWEKNGSIWVANPDVEDSAFPEFTKPGYELIGNFTSLFKAPLKVTLDNFGEIEHAFQVHSFIGPKRNDLHTVNFSVDVGTEETYGYLACKYRQLPLYMSRFLGIKSEDLYHNDWVFKFKPLHGSYHNYWTDKTNTIKRPVSTIITSFLVPVNDKEVNVHVFVQLAITNKAIKLIGPLIKRFTMAVTKYEIKADADIAKFAPADPEGDNHWKLTRYDKQIMPNRNLMESIYFGKKKKDQPIYNLEKEKNLEYF